MQSLHVVGARPNFMKAAPVVAALVERGSRPYLVHTGQHYDEAMSKIFFGQLGMPEPDRNLGIGSGSHAVQTAALMTALEDLFLELDPYRVVVYGDVNSTLAAALVASKLEIPVAHVEAGLRSFDRSMPEEINRIVTDSVSDLHFVTSPEALGHLAREGIADGSMHFVGNPMIDTLMRFRDHLDVDGVREAFGLPIPYAVVTLHRPSSVDDPEAVERVVEGLRRASRHIDLIVPLHPRGREQLERAGLGEFARVVEPLGYLDFMALVMGSRVVLTDSGGIQEETTVLGIPCLTLRENTERPITITMGTNRLVGTDPDAIEKGVVDVSSWPRGETPPLWDGRAGKRIAEILLSTVPD
ncbi:MAG TPA: UDP-N-acetylglucosamine 2-epimerase (non-hydrolyzing) [Acidimicrobiia bacterium]